jgi:hypothetical protein
MKQALFSTNLVVHSGIMESEPANLPARSSSPAAQRMRLYRKRRRRGVRCIRVPIDAADIDALIKKKLLQEEDRHDPGAIKIAICDLLFEMAYDA